MTTGCNGKFVLVGEFSAGAGLVDGVVSKSLDRRRFGPGFLRLQIIAAAECQTPVHDICMVAHRMMGEKANYLITRTDEYR